MSSGWCCDRLPDRSGEPDAAYYIQNQPLVAGRIVDLTKDPPPDLVVEVDITHTDIDKLQLYAAMGVPEFWRYNGETWRIYQLQGSVYEEVEKSPTFTIVPKTKLYEFLATARMSEMQADRELREWVRSTLKGDNLLPSYMWQGFEKIRRLKNRG